MSVGYSSFSFATPITIRTPALNQVMTTAQIPNINAGVTYATPATQPSTRNYCSQFSGVDCIEPEPYASRIDIITASQAVENAIHAPDINTTTTYLREAMMQLQHAVDYFRTAGLTTLLTATQNAMNTLNTLITQLQTTNNLMNFQQNNLYGYMGVLASLNRQVSSYQI